MIIFSITILVLISSMFVLMFIDSRSKNKWFCEKFGWHKAPDKVGFDGCSMNGKCSRCGKDVLQDSNGDWFC